MPPSRSSLVASLAERLERDGYPRLQMLLVVCAAGAAGFLSSVLMLWLGLTYMPVRYALATAAGYGTFLYFMKLWLGSAHGATSRAVRDSGIDLFDVPGSVLRGTGRAASKTADVFFRGGRSGGAGASASFDAGPAPVMMPVPPSNGGGSSGKSFVDLDLDEDSAKLLLPLLAIAAILIGLIACLSVVWSAPNTLAEVLVDGAVAGAAYQRLKHADYDWTRGVVRQTWKAALAIFVTFVLLGWAGQHFKPGADSIGDFFQ